VFAVSMDLNRLDLGGSVAGSDRATKGLSREELEKMAIRNVVAFKHLLGLDHREDEFSALCYELKESVRREKAGVELAEQIARSPLLEAIVAADSPSAAKIPALQEVGEGSV